MGADTFTLRIIYDRAMNTGLNPAVTFTSFGTMGGYDAAQSWWVSDTQFKATYTVVDNNVYIPHVDVTVTGGYDTVGNLQDASTILDVFSINTASTPAQVVGVVPTVTEVTDNNVGTPLYPWDPGAPSNAGLEVRITYDQAMQGNTPTVSFSPNVAGTLTYNAAHSWWTSPTTFKASYDVADANVLLNPISINVSGARDTTGGHYDQARYSGPAGFSIDTLDPAPALAAATPTTNLTLVSDWNVGTDTFVIRLAYDKSMRTGVTPTITFSPNVSSTLQFDAGASWWITDTLYQAKYSVVDTNIPLTNVGIVVTGARDLIGNLQSSYSGTNNFSVDMVHPPARTSVGGVTPNLTTVTAANVGSHTLWETIVFGTTMNTNFNPVVTLSSSDNPAGLSSTLSYNAAWSWWTNDTAFIARWDVAGSNAVVTTISISVTGAKDTIGNAQVAYSGAAGFNIDTTSPGLGALPRAALADAVLSSGALNSTVGTVNRPTSQPSAINPVDHALLYSGTWLDI